jgi:hypothetical protein
MCPFSPPHHSAQSRTIDWLVSSDDGPDSFLKRLKNDLEQLEIKNG